MNGCVPNDSVESGGRVGAKNSIEKFFIKELGMFQRELTQCRGFDMEKCLVKD